MAGGLFAIDRKYFFEIGAYDRQLTYWGGENVELSFKVYMNLKDPLLTTSHCTAANASHNAFSDRLRFSDLDFGRSVVVYRCSDRRLTICNVTIFWMILDNANSNYSMVLIAECWIVF